MQEHAACRPYALHGTQVAGVALHQRGRQQALGQQGLRAIDIGHHGVQQAGTLLDAGFYARPFVA